MLTNEGGSKALVYVTQPYMNLDNARAEDDIDLMLGEPVNEPVRYPVTGGLPVSLDLNEIHDTSFYTPSYF